jgi:hypothetical protein
MVFEIFTALVGLLAVVYAGIAKFLQNRLVDKSEMEAIQAESKRLSEEFNKAKKSNDQKKMDRIMKEQMDFLPRMNSAMMKQFRPMIVILLILFAFTWVVNTIDPTTKDDVTVNLTDDGAGCDKMAGDGIFTACYQPDGGEPGKWTALFKAYDNGRVAATNETYFSMGESDGDTYVENGVGESMEVSTDKAQYDAGQTITLFAAPANMTKGTDFIVQILPPARLNVDSVQATVSEGTYFRVDLPLTIPLINVKSIYQPYWWFIFVSLITNIGITLVMNQMKKK